MISAVVACAPAPDRGHFTVEYYRAHADERNGMIAQCANDPGTQGRDPDCINAREAARIEGVGSLQRLPPMGLSGKANRATPVGGAPPRS